MKEIDWLQIENALNIILRVANYMEHLHELDFTNGNLILDNIFMMQIGTHFIAKVSNYGGFIESNVMKFVDMKTFVALQSKF